MIQEILSAEEWSKRYAPDRVRWVARLGRAHQSKLKPFLGLQNELPELSHLLAQRPPGGLLNPWAFLGHAWVPRH